MYDLETPHINFAPVKAKDLKVGERCVLPEGGWVWTRTAKAEKDGAFPMIQEQNLAVSYFASGMDVLRIDVAE